MLVRSQMAYKQRRTHCGRIMDREQTCVRRHDTRSLELEVQRKVRNGLTAESEAADVVSGSGFAVFGTG
jgi:hypothetical protein